MTASASTRPKPVAKWRTCLGCNRRFRSVDHLCKRCNRRNRERPLPPQRAGAGVHLPYVHDEVDEDDWR